MLGTALTALACLSAACATPSYYPPKKPTLARTYASDKNLVMVLESIDQRLGTLEMLTLEQKHQSKRLDEIHKKIDLLETEMTVRLEQAELSKHYLERRLHALQTSIQDSIELGSDRVDRSLTRVETASLNITNTLKPYKKVFDQAEEAYRETLRRGVVLEGLTRDGLALVNVTRREMADGLRSLARRQREYRLTGKELEAVVSEAGNEVFNKLAGHTERLDGKVRAVLTKQEQFLDTCQAQRDRAGIDTQLTDLLDKLLDNVINKTAITFQKLQAIQNDIKTHDTKVSRALANRNSSPNEGILKKIESVIKNASSIHLRESELQKLTDKYIDLTNRADAALQRLELKVSEHLEPADADITSDADKLIDKLKSINSEEDDDYDDYGPSYRQDEEDYEEQMEAMKLTTERPSHRRHLHKHPYDRGPKRP